MKNIFCFLICHFYFVSSKLIASNTLQEISSIDLNDQNINLTVWIQVRFPIDNDEQKRIMIMRIIDQENNDQVLINFIIVDHQQLRLFFKLQNNSSQTKDLYIEDWNFEWQKITILRDQCFNRLQYFDVNISITCDNQFNATLFLIQDILFHVFIYDKEQFNNEEIILSNLLQTWNIYQIHTLKDNLVIKFYAKFYQGQDQDIFFFFNLFSIDTFLCYQYHQNKIKMYLKDSNQQIHQIQKIELSSDQWVLFSIEFDELDIIIQYNINNTTKMLVVQIDHYFDVTKSLYFDYVFQTQFNVLNTNRMAIQYLQIYSLVETDDYNVCTKDCQFCIYNQCLDKVKPSVDFEISNELKSSMYFNELYFQNYEYLCNDKNYYKDQGEYCIEFPKYQGQYCYNCEIEQKQIIYLNNNYDYGLLVNSFDYYLNSFHKIPKGNRLKNNGLFFEKDLNIFIMKSKDIYLAYRLQNYVFCENGYTHYEKCKKVIRNCLIQILKLYICQQKYTFVNNKCIKCQRNCLYCRIIKNTITCILMVSDYYKNSNGLIKQCNKNSQIFNCLPKDEAIRELKEKGHQICQRYEIYDYQISQCAHMNNYGNIFQFLEYYPIQIKYDEEKLEIQDVMAGQSEQMDSWIIGLISFQQMSKLSKLVLQQKKYQNLLTMHKNFELLSLMNCSVEDLSSKNITLHDIKIFLSDIPIIIYQNKKYKYLTNITDQLNIQFKIIQFDIVIYQHLFLINQVYDIEIDYENYLGITFILNISFNFNPSLLYRIQNQIYFKANKIIIHDLLFDQIEETFEEGLKDQPIFDIKSNQIVINNIMIQNVKLRKLFQLMDFYYLVIQNLWIKNSSIDVFINSQKFIFSYQIIRCENIYSIKSDLTNFIEIYNVQNMQIHNITYISTQFNGFHFLLRGDIISITIYNLQLINVTLINSRLFNVKFQKRFVYSNLQLLNLYVHESKIISSSFFLIQNVNQIIFQQIYLYLVIFQESNFINFQYIVMTKMEQVCFYQLNIEGIFSLLYSKDYNQTILNDFYVKKIYSQNQQLFFFRGNRTQIRNLNFHRFDIQVVSLIQIESQEIQILKFIFKHFVTQTAVHFTVNLFSLCKLSIKGMVFKSAVLNGTSLLVIYTIDSFFLRYLYIHNIDITTSNQQQLILFQNALKKNLIQYIYLRDINVKTQDKNYTIFQFSNQKEVCKLVIMHLQIKQIKNQSPSNTIYTINTDLFQMELYNIRILSTISINFLYSSSSLLVMHHFYIYNIVRVFIDYQSFIMHKSPQIIYEKERIEICSFQVNYFEGMLITLETENQMQATLKDFTVNMFISNLQLFKFYLITNLKEARLLIYSFQISNQLIDSSRQLQNAFIETNFDLVFINIACIYNVSKQFLKTQYITSITFIDFYVNQYNSNDTILDIQFEFLIINRFMIYNSQILQGSAINLIFQENNLRIDNVQFIDVTVNKAVIKLSSTLEQATIKLIDIVLKGVISNQFLFQTTSSVKQFTTSIIGGQSIQIYSSNIKNIEYINGLITDIKKDCILSENSQIYLNQSEIVNSKIIQKQDQMVRHKSQFLGTFQDFTSNIMIFLSLNNGKSFFNQIQTQKNLFQLQFPKNNKYLYLPSGREIQEYLYFNFASREYSKIYDSISYVSLFQAQKIQCILQQNYDNQTIYKQDLVLLPGVNKIHNLTFTLNPYFKDKYIELDLICNQNESKITYRTLIKTFNCQLGEHLIKDQCVLCDIKSYLYSVGYNQQYCLYQDQNTIEQLKIGQIKLYQQFWRHSYANKYIEQCQNQNCLGGWQPGDNSCSVGYLGALCSECDVYNVRGLGNFGKINNQCSQCYFDYSIYLKGLLIILIQLLLIFVSQNTNQQLSQQYLFLRISKREFTEILLRQNINQVTILFKLYYNYLFTLYLMKDSINFGQLIDLSLNMVYNPGLIAVPQVDCLINSLFQYPIQYTQLIIKILLPISLLNFIVIIYAFLIKFSLSKYSIYIIIVCLLIIHQQNQQVILQSLIKLLSPIKYSNVYWTLENLNIQFYSNTHQHYLQVLIIPLIILITVINILIFIWIRYINKRIFIHLKLSLFIYKQYKNQFYYWEYFRLAFVYIFMLILYSYENTYILLLTIFILTISHLYKPFELQNVNQIDQIIYILSLYTYFGILIHQKDNSPNKFIIIIISNIILLKLFFKYFLHSLNIQYRQQKVQYINKMVNYMPKLGSYINVALYNKNEYYYSILKQSRKKSKTTINTIIQSTVSQSNPSMEVEMVQINKK